MLNNFSSNEYGKTFNIFSIISIKLDINKNPKKLNCQIFRFLKYICFLKGALQVVKLPFHNKMNYNWFPTTKSLCLYSPLFFCNKPFCPFMKHVKKYCPVFSLVPIWNFWITKEKKKKKKNWTCQMSLRCYTKYNFSEANVCRKWKRGTVMD